MDKKTFVAAIILLSFLVSLVAGMQAVKVAKANPIPWAFNPQMTVTIQSPVSGANCALPLLVSFKAQGDWQFSVSDNVTQAYLRSFFYVLDGQDMSTSGQRFAGTKTTEIIGDPVYSHSFIGEANLTEITDGLHSITVYYGAVNNASLIGTPSEWIVYNHNLSWQATSQFYVDSALTPSPTITITPSPSPSQIPTPALTVSLSESASALNFGNRINFTVTVDGGKEPYIYAWYLDNQLPETSTSPHYALGSLSVGSHHVYVQVSDIENNSATTLTVAFEVLPIASSFTPSTNMSLSPSPTQQPTPAFTGSYVIADPVVDYTSTLMLLAIIALTVVLGITAYFHFGRTKKQK
jgi:hypothetical protein